MRTVLRAVLYVCVLILAAVVAAGCGSSADTAGAADAPKQQGGTVVIGMDQPPGCLNNWLVCGGMASAKLLTTAMFDAPLVVDENSEYAPEFALEVPTTENGGVVETPNGGMLVTFHLRPDARWSDGHPITCDDAVFTWNTIMDDRWMIGERTGYDQIRAVTCPDAQTVVYDYKTRYAPYLAKVGSSPYLPKHALAGKDFNTFMSQRIDVSSGPFVFDHWNRSVEVVLKRNPKYWNAGADDRPWLDTLRFKFITDTNTLKIQLRTGEVDMIMPSPDTSLREELESIPRATFQSEPGGFWEQLAFNNAKAPTNDPNVRNAIAFSIDRQQITDIVLKKQVGVLNSTILASHKEYYVPAWEDVTPDAKKVARLLEESGYERDGTYYAKDGKVLTVQFRSTAGNALRMKVAQLLQQELRSNGIKMEIAFDLPEVFFGQTTKQGAFNIALWAWSSGVDPTQKTLFSCDEIPSEANDYGGNNNYRYCNEHVSDLLAQSDVEPDTTARAALLEQVQREMRKDMPILPLFQRPETLAYNERVQGLVVNPLTYATWNASDWAVRQ